MITKAYFAAFAWETTLSTVIILQKLQPVFAIGLAALILKERLSRHFYFWAAIAIVSGYMIAFESMWRDFLSLEFFKSPSFYALLAAFAYGSSTVFGKNLVTELGFRISTALRFIMTAVLSFWVLLIFWDILSLWNFEMDQWKLFGIIVFSSWAVALFVYYFGLRRVHASSASIFELAYPLTWIFFDWYFNGSILSLTQIIFSLVLIVSFFMIIRENRES
jgi:drug/metabolite transporter (DMT)-like permease